MDTAFPMQAGGVLRHRGRHPGVRLVASTCRQYLFDSTWRGTLGCFALLSTLLTALFCLVGISEPLGLAVEPGSDLLLTALLGWTTFLAGSALAGSLVAGNEWNSGRFVVSFALTPRRWMVVAAHVGCAAACGFLVALPLLVGQLGLVHVLAAGAKVPGWGAGGLLAAAPDLAAVVLLAALGSGCAAAMGAATAMLMRSRVGGTLVMAAIFFILPALAAAAGLRPELLPVAQWSSLATVPLSGGAALLAAAAPAALAWPLGAGLAAAWRTARYDLA